MAHTATPDIAADYAATGTRHSDTKGIWGWFKSKISGKKEVKLPSETLPLPFGYFRSSISVKKLNELKLRISENDQDVLDQNGKRIEPKELEELIDGPILAKKGEDPKFTVGDVTLTRLEMSFLKIDYKSDEKGKFFVDDTTKEPISLDDVRRKRAQLSISNSSTTKTEEITPAVVEQKEEIVADEIKTQPASLQERDDQIFVTTRHDEPDMESSEQLREEKENVENRRSDSTPSPPESGSGRDGSPPSDDREQTVIPKEPRKPWYGLVVVLAIIALISAFFVLNYFDMWNQISGTLLVVTFGFPLMAIGLARKPKNEIAPQVEETDEEATKAAGRLASASLRGKTKREASLGRMGWSGRGYPEFVFGALLITGLALYWLNYGLQYGLQHLSVPLYVVPLALILISVLLLLKYVKGWTRLLILLLLGASAWLFFTEHPFGTPKQKVIDFGEKERTVYLNKIIQLRKDSAARAEDFNASINRLSQNASQNQAAALRHIRDSAARVDSALRSDLHQKDSLFQQGQADNANLRANQALTYHPKMVVPISIGILIIAAFIATLFFRQRWVGYAVLGLTILGLAFLVWWISTFNIPLQKTVPITVPNTTWYQDSIHLRDSIEYYKNEWEKEQKRNVTQNIPAMSTVDSTVSEVHKDTTVVEKKPEKVVQHNNSNKKTTKVTKTKKKKTKPCDTVHSYKPKRVNWGDYHNGKLGDN